uniref:Uncharacterized protein n=1 Tax=Arundo donax TaxID=35708 RepID=A0A0A9FT65_ARUDO
MSCLELQPPESN